MSPENPPTPERVLAIGAHPDDLEFMAGGTLAHWAAAGAQITYCIVTDGASGSRDPSMTNERLIALRQEEQRAAAAEIGAEEVIFLGYPDGRLVPSLEVRFDIARVIRRTRPDVLITNDPTVRWSANFGYINHPDHIATGEATLAAVMPTANTLLAAPELLDEGLDPHDVGEVLLSSWGNSTLYIALSEEDIRRKAKALQAHVSQLGGKDMFAEIKEWSARTAEMAREHGFDGAYAEGFLRIVLRRPQPEQPESSEDASETPTA